MSSPNILRLPSYQLYTLNPHKDTLEKVVYVFRWTFKVLALSDSFMSEKLLETLLDSKFIAEIE